MPTTSPFNSRRAHRSTRASAHASRATLSQLTSVATLLALLAACVTRWADIHRRRSAARPAAKPETVQVWEDEGGQNQMPDAPK